MKSEDESFRTLEAVLKIAAQGVDAAEASLTGGSLGMTRFADNEVHQATEVSRDVVGIRIVHEGRSASVQTSDLSLEGVQAATRQARMMAQYMPEPEEPVELPGPQKYWPTEAFDEMTDRIGPLDRMAVVGRIFLQARRRQLNASGFVCTRRGSLEASDHGPVPYAVANTRGLAAYHAQTHASVSVTLEQGGVSGWAQSDAFSAARLDADHLTDVAATKALRQRRVRSIGPGRYTVVLEPAAVAALLEYLALTVGAESMEQGNSFLCDRIGDSIASEKVSIRDDHGHILHRGRPFDIEGVAKQRVDIIENGVAKGPVYSYASAKRHDVEPTGHRTASTLFGLGERAEHLVMEGDDRSVEELVEGTKSGILITRLWYVRHRDPRTLTLTGVTRDGTFLIEDGKVVSGLRNMRFNISLLDILNNVDGLSRSVRALGMVVPAMKVHDFGLSGAVDA